MSDYKTTDGFFALSNFCSTSSLTGAPDSWFRGEQLWLYPTPLLTPHFQRASSCICYCPGNQSSSPSFSSASPLTVRGGLRGSQNLLLTLVLQVEADRFFHRRQFKSLCFLYFHVHVSEKCCLSASKCPWDAVTLRSRTHTWILSSGNSTSKVSAHEISFSHASARTRSWC